jgi:SAM-dependent methyltransferase
VPPTPHETAVYTHGHHASVLRSHTWRTAANSAGYLLGSLTPDMRVLDIGCGPGTITADLAELVPDGDVTALDNAPAIVERAAAHAAERGLDNVHVALGDVHALDFPDGTFDVTHAHQVLQHVGDPVRALREMRRVTRPGGLVAVRDADYPAMTWFPGSDGLEDWLAVYLRVATANGGAPDAGRRLRSWALAAGFAPEAVTASASAWCYASAAERSWWADLWAERTVASSYAELAVAGGHATADRLTAIANAWRAWAAETDGWFAVLHGELLCRV